LPERFFRFNEIEWFRNISPEFYPEAAVSYILMNVDVGKRLMEPHSKYKELNGITATAYLDKAETMFREMDLEWYLE
jgi:hypothetical protein